MRYRPEFAAHAGISKRSLANVELDDASVGGPTLEAIGRAIPGWDKDTPRAILEGGTPPPVRHDEPNPPAPDAASEEIPEAHQKIIAMSEREIAERIVDLSETSREAALAYGEDVLRIRLRYAAKRGTLPSDT